jgi:hypothetical protein
LFINSFRASLNLSEGYCFIATSLESFFLLKKSFPL